MRVELGHTADYSRRTSRAHDVAEICMAIDNALSDGPRVQVDLENARTEPERSAA
jgi:hypothetical protein